MNIRLGTYLNLTHLTILNANFHSYQLNNCNCLFNCLSDITKLFCCRFNASEGKLFLCIFPPNQLAEKSTFRQIGLPTNLSHRIVSRQIGPAKLSRTQPVSHFSRELLLTTGNITLTL